MRDDLGNFRFARLRCQPAVMPVLPSQLAGAYGRTAHSGGNENRWGSIGMPGGVTRMNSLACCAGSCAQLLNVGRGSSTSPLDTGLHPQLNCRTGSESYRSGTHPPPAEIPSPVPEGRTRRILPAKSVRTSPSQWVYLLVSRETFGYQFGLIKPDEKSVTDQQFVACGDTDPCLTTCRAIRRH